VSIFCKPRRRGRGVPGSRRPALPRWLPLGLFGLIVAGGAALPSRSALPSAAADPPPVAPPAAQVAPPPVQPAAAAQPQPGPKNPMDEPLRLVAQARHVHAQVQTYTCTLVSQERVQGRLEPENVVAMTMRTQPFSVHMRWLAPKDAAGREVIYVAGRNKGMMRVLDSSKVGRMLGFINIAPNDPRVLEHSRHTIVEAGLGNLIEQFARNWEADRRLGKARAQMAEYEYDRKRCVRVEVAQTERNPQAYCFRSVVYFDKQTRLPIRVECYDWPRAGGPPGGDLLETFSYAGLQLNVPLNDALFNR
jgi:hypothetical protein